MNPDSVRRTFAACLGAAALCAGAGALATEFSVTPIRVDLSPGALSETITVTNHAKEKLRVGVRLMEWTQDAEGKDLYQDSSELVYFPRQLELEGDSKRLVRVGLKSAPGTVERAYRLYIEEQPEAAVDPGRSQVSFYFRFGVPVFVPPAVAKAQPQVGEPKLQAGKLSIAVDNPGNQHFRLTKIVITGASGYRQELAGWYSLAGSHRTYSADIPRDVCRKAGTLNIALEGEDFRLDRKLDVDPASCT